MPVRKIWPRRTQLGKFPRHLIFLFYFFGLEVSLAPSVRPGKHYLPFDSSFNLFAVPRVQLEANYTVVLCVSTRFSFYWPVTERGKESQETRMLFHRCHRGTSRNEQQASSQEPPSAHHTSCTIYVIDKTAYQEYISQSDQN